MIALRSFLFHFLFYSGGIILSILMIPTLFLRRAVFLSSLFTGYAAFLLKYVVGLTYEIEGGEHIPKDGGFMIVANHQSAWETFLFFKIFKSPVMILKKELLYVPLFGGYLKRTGMLAIDRKNPAAGFRNLLKNIEQTLTVDKRPVCIFPEGTRKELGKPGDLQKGIFVMYNAVKAPILCVVHDAGAYWPPHKFLIKPGKVKVFIYPVLPPVFEEETLRAILPGMMHTKANELARKHGE
jgi:1-acyl-sn-glycerol-3-phosphate acyltransferase